MAGQMPPAVMPSSGAVVRKSQSMTPMPLTMMNPRMAKSITTTPKLNRRNRPNAIFCVRRFLVAISYLCLLDTASTVKLINKLMKKSTTPSMNRAP